MNEIKNINHIVSELEDIQVRLTCGNDMMFALHTAMETGTLTPETTRNAFWGIADYIDSLVKNMGKRVSEANEALVAAAKEGGLVQ